MPRKANHANLTMDRKIIKNEIKQRTTNANLQASLAEKPRTNNSLISIYQKDADPAFLHGSIRTAELNSPPVRNNYHKPAVFLSGKIYFFFLTPLKGFRSNF